MTDVTSVESSVPATQEWEETPDLFGAYPRLTEGQIATLLPGGTRRPVGVDEILIREGVRSDELFLILSGKVAIVTDDESGERRVLRVHGPGRFLGELGDLEGQPAFYTAIVVAEGEVLAVPTSRVRALVAHDQISERHGFACISGAPFLVDRAGRRVPDYRVVLLARLHPFTRVRYPQPITAPMAGSGK